MVVTGGASTFGGQKKQKPNKKGKGKGASCVAGSILLKTALSGRLSRRPPRPKSSRETRNLDPTAHDVRYPGGDWGEFPRR